MDHRAIIAVKKELFSRLIKAGCREFQVETRLISNTEDPIGAVTEYQPEIIFLDELFLKGHDGLISQIRDLEVIGDAYLVMVSHDLEYSTRFRELGMDAFLPVPFSKMKFDSVLQNVLVNKPKTILIAHAMGKDTSDLYTSLVSEGFNIIFAETGDKCMYLTHKFFPSLILVGYELDDMSGIELCMRLKEASLSSHIPVMILSIVRDDATVEKCFQAGAEDILLFPFFMQENLDKVKNLIRAPKKGRIEKALVIDDSPMIRNMIGKMFKQLGFSTISAENGKIALDELEKQKLNPPDIITCDYDMPVMNGWDFCNAARKIQKINKIPIIMVTARGTEVDKKKGKVLGVYDYLIKPFKIENLRKSVFQALAESRSLKEKEALSKYVAQDVMQNVSDVISGLKDQEPEEKYLTILFCDICSFTAKCEKFSAKEIVKLLNSFFDRMIAILQAYHAIIDKLIGDAIMVKFDSGNKAEDALNSVKAAWEMLESQHQFNLNSLEPMEIRIGINSGNVIVGNLGSESYRLDYTLIGDNVNIAQRLESQAEQMGCLISQATYQLVQNAVIVGEGHTLALKGKNEGVLAYPLLGLK
jgi:DNA-binding response OmpR family regulator